MARILVVEDNPANQQLMTYLLERAGHAAPRAADGAAGLEMARQERPDLILMDIHMPVMGGYEALMLIREDPLLRNVPVVALTALAMVGDRERVLSAGFDGYLAKPIAPETFAAHVEAFLRSRVSRPSAAVPAPAAGAWQGTRRNSVLLLAESRADVEVVLGALEPVGCEVRPAHTLAQALALARANPPGLVMVDAVLAGSSAKSVIDAFKPDPGLPSAPIVLIAARGWSRDDVARAIAQGAAMVIERPIEADKLAGRVARCLEVRRRREEGQAWP